MKNRMQAFKNIIWFLIALFSLTSCIDSYKPVIKSNDKGKYVVMGNVDKNDTVQTVNVSMTSSISDPNYIAVTGCSVEIQNDKGINFPLSDNGDGTYTGKIDPQYMTPGSAFRVNIKTPDGTDIESDYDTISSCPPVDSVYYNQESQYTNNANDENKGIQLYSDLKGQNSDSRYYKWTLTETWEYHAKWPIRWYYYLGTVYHVVPDDYSKMVCWHTLLIPKIYLLSTKNLSDNDYKRFPLNFVGSDTRRLEYGYSLLIKLEALSHSAYVFWERMRLNNNSNGGLYEKQPLTVIGNLHNVTHPNIQVLGFFSAVSSHTKRIFIHPIPGLQLTFKDFCTVRALRKGIIELRGLDYIVYLAGNDETYFPTVYTRECVDCTLLGGVTDKPSYWPN
ncbi:MAG: DUF4249 domain-containing protein [Bacteroidales bacterium]|nr:DUF4249 domain-containing protein [Bacteroidales bacterium]